MTSESAPRIVTVRIEGAKKGREEPVQEGKLVQDEQIQCVGSQVVEETSKERKPKIVKHQRDSVGKILLTDEGLATESTLLEDNT